MQAASSTAVFECPICFDRYNESDHSPRVLTCGHTCCMKCADSLYTWHDQSAGDRKWSQCCIACPICRRISAPHPRALPINFGILHALPTTPVEPPPPTVVHECSMCNKTKRPVVSHCETCNLFLCEVHTGNHLDDHEDHVLQPIAPIQRSMCPRHPKKELEFYCNDCKKLICANCCVLDHITHNRLDIQVAFDNLKPSMLRTISQSRMECDEMNYMINQLKGLERDLSDKETDLAACVQTMRRELKHNIDDRCDELVSSLPTKRLAIESHRHAIESQSEQLSAGSQSSQARLDSNDKIHCLSKADPLIALFSSMADETKADNWRQVKYDSHLSLFCSFIEVFNSIKQFGKLDSSNATIPKERKVYGKFGLV